MKIQAEASGAKNSYSVREILNIFKYRVKVLQALFNIFSGIIIFLKEVLMNNIGRKP